MSQSDFRRYLLFSIFAFFLLSCSYLGIQPKKEKAVSTPIPDCQSNRTKEGGLVSAPIYKTWVRYDRLDFKKGFDLAIRTLHIQGHRVVLMDRVSGTITAEMALGKEQEKPYPATIKITQEQSSLVLGLSLKGERWGSGPPDLCSFYHEFGRLAKRASPASKSQPVALPPQKPREEQKPLQTPLPTSSPAPDPASPPTRPTSVVSTGTDFPSFSRGEVVWSRANLRDGPGLHYKVIGKAYKGNAIEIHEEKDGWLRVRLEDGKDGWLSKKAVLEGSKSPSSSNVPASKEEPTKPKAQTKPKSPM
ncbi:MAG: hypothetical protein A2162_12240 [Deltaproteobacteria bacterium RBG_13_52_11b]|nr:MAG: hypothetical protein A2162_12240 [Deltaproteobacteria bacterium RBG_13_52_11b]